VSSFGVIENLQRQLMEQQGIQRRSQLPKMGHGGTLDPFATGLLVVLVGRGVKLARYFLGSIKTYEGIIRFGEATAPGDPTSPVTETSSILPESLAQLKEFAHSFTLRPYLQIPPMHSAKKKNGKPLYELARAGVEIEREPKLCSIYEFEILNFESPDSQFRVRCGSGTYVRTLAQDLAQQIGTIAHLRTLHRTQSGVLSIQNAWTVDQIQEATKNHQKWDELPCWVPFDRLLDGYARTEATSLERQDLIQGKQAVLPQILERVQSHPKDIHSSDQCVVIYCSNRLVAVARKENQLWGLERVFVD
jgi:tRNA pseudouridine55 synthase